MRAGVRHVRGLEPRDAVEATLIAQMNTIRTVGAFDAGIFRAAVDKPPLPQTGLAPTKPPTIDCLEKSLWNFAQAQKSVTRMKATAKPVLGRQLPIFVRAVHAGQVKRGVQADNSLSRFQALADASRATQRLASYQDKANASFATRQLAGHQSPHSKNAPAQRAIELVDRESGHCEEQDNVKPASGAGKLYYTGNAHAGNRADPMFLSAVFIDNTIKELEAIQHLNDDTDDDVYHEKPEEALGWARGNFDDTEAIDFYTESEKTTDPANAGFRIEQALKSQILKDPQGRRDGFSNRFPDAKGHLFSTQTKDGTEQDLGALPERVIFVRQAPDRFEQFVKWNRNKKPQPILWGKYFYCRQFHSEQLSRNAVSVFTAKDAAGMQETIRDCRTRA